MEIIHLYDGESPGWTPPFWFHWSRKPSHFLFWAAHLHVTQDSSQNWRQSLSFIHTRTQTETATACDTPAEDKNENEIVLVEMVIKPHVKLTLCFLVAGRPSGVCEEEEFMGTGCKLIVTKPVEAVFVCARSLLRGENTELFIFYFRKESLSSIWSTSLKQWSYICTRKQRLFQ